MRGIEVEVLVLLADGDEAVAEMYRIGLEFEGYRVAIASDAAALEAAISLGRLDVLVIDWELPGIQQDDLVRRLQEYETPLIVLTNAISTAEEVRDHLNDAGGAARLIKSNTPPNVLAQELHHQVIGRKVTPEQRESQGRHTVREIEAPAEAPPRDDLRRPDAHRQWQRFIELRARWRQLKRSFEDGQRSGGSDSPG